jgi:serine/threonine protein kinase
MNADLKTNGDGLYLLTARTGSFPYMAPEVVLGQPYNETCDVFSFTILVWEMLALKPSFLKLKTRREFKTKVVEGGARPYIPSRKWGMMTYKVLTTGWKASPKERPSMDDICTMLRTELAASEVYDEGIFANRSIFLQERSMRSMHSSMFSEKKSPRMTMAGKKQISRADTV